MFLSHNRLYLFLVAFNVPVYSLFCCGAALFLEPFSSVSPAVVSLAIVKVSGFLLQGGTSFMSKKIKLDTGERGNMDAPQVHS